MAPDGIWHLIPRRSQLILINSQNSNFILKRFNMSERVTQSWVQIRNSRFDGGKPRLLFPNSEAHTRNHGIDPERARQLSSLPFGASRDAKQKPRHSTRRWGWAVPRSIPLGSGLQGWASILRGLHPGTVLRAWPGKSWLQQARIERNGLSMANIRRRSVHVRVGKFLGDLLSRGCTNSLYV